MKFCPNCGTANADEAQFCTNCGASVAAQPAAPARPVYQQPATPPVYMAAEPKIPGRGMGIAGMVLGIIGIVYAVIFFIDVLSWADNYFARYYLEEAIPTIIIFSALGILATVFGAVARRKGFVSGVSTSGLALGIVSLVFYLLSVIICLAT